MAAFVGQEDSITFGMGFATNAASIPALAGPGTLVLSDALNHTSIVAGAGGAIYQQQAVWAGGAQARPADGAKETRQAGAGKCLDQHARLACLMARC